MSVRRALYTLAAPAFCASLAWVGGYDFDTRGIGPAYLFFIAGFCAVVVWSYPGWDE